MTESKMTLPITAPRWRPPGSAVLVAGAVLLASLGAAAGWLMRGEPPIAGPDTPPVAQLAPASADRPVADDEVAPPRPDNPSAPAVQAPEAKPPSKPTPGRRAPAATQGSGTRVAAVCQRCGVVEGVTEVRRKGEANGIGAVAGGVLGGVIGNQMGGGNGKKAMTVVGAVGGGLAGHEIEKRARGDIVYQVRVRMDDGSTRTVTVKNAPANGARVTVEGESLRVVS